MVLNNYLLLVQMLSTSPLLGLNKSTLRKQIENRQMSCLNTFTNRMLMSPLKAEIVKNNRHNREFSSYVLLFYWVFLHLWWNFNATIMPQSMMHNESENLSFTIYISMLILFSTSAYTVAKVHLSYFMQRWLPYANWEYNKQNQQYLAALNSCYRNKHS